MSVSKVALRRFGSAVMVGLAVSSVALGCAGVLAAEAPATKEGAKESGKAKVDQWEERRHESAGSVTVNGRKIDYAAISGTIMIEDKKGQPGALMSYTAYFKKGEEGGAKRPLTFIYNGGPGSATLWLHMGAFGPKRVISGDAVRGPAAPYKVVNNDYSPLDVSDLVFIDMPGTGYGRVGVDEKIAGAESPDKLEAVLKKNEEVKKDFWGVDQDARAFDIFIVKFLGKYDRWNSPKFLFGESYGTLRSAVLAHELQDHSHIDLNGVMLLSQILNYGSSADSGRNELGEDMPFMLSLPTMAATAWYHKKLPNRPSDLEAFLAEVRQFSLTDYSAALSMGDSLSAEGRRAVATKLHGYTGLSIDYLEKANLRVSGGMFRKMLRDDEGLVVGRLDTRYASPPLDPLGKEADYDPQSAAISSAYVAAFNEYSRETLGYGRDDDFKSGAEVFRIWDTKHQPPGAQAPLPKTLNVIPDLAATMRANPRLKVLLCSGYFDLSTLFFAGEFELNHLMLPPELRKNIEIKHFLTGHMVYVNEDGLRQLHDAFAGFVGKAMADRG